jgi:hypothetical protein
LFQESTDLFIHKTSPEPSRQVSVPTSRIASFPAKEGHGILDEGRKHNFPAKEQH